MSSSPTPTVDALRESGAWGSLLDEFAEWDLNVNPETPRR